MNAIKYKYILIFITTTIVATIGLQIFWNLKNYKENKSRIINEIQIAFDNSVENYFVTTTKENFIGFVNNQKNNSNFFEELKKNSVFKDLVKKKRDRKNKKNLKEILKNKDKIDTSKVEIKISYNDLNNNEQPSIEANKISSIKVYRGKKDVDSLTALTYLAEKIIFTISNDTVDLQKLKTFVDLELKRKTLVIDYQIEHLKNKTVFNKLFLKQNPNLILSTISKSSYLKNNQNLNFTYSDPSNETLKRSATGILLSLLLCLSIIACLLYLLKIINLQKKIDVIKNDLISNITHEFKTPITTILTAIEGMKNFNLEKDFEKTNRYLHISELQINKLSVMVDRILETATLDSDKLILRKENINLIELINNTIDKYSVFKSNKQIILTSIESIIDVNVDAFHFENVISNLLDNAIKYGGNEIKISVQKQKNETLVCIQDNGDGIENEHKLKIFEQFYRVPKRNIHDIKGFGIGLYYSQKIMQKHNGNIELAQNKNLTIFQISVPNE